jgi:hypothetical protein
VTTHTEGSRFSVLFGDAQGRFAETAESPLDLGNKAWHMGLVDVNLTGGRVVAVADTVSESFFVTAEAARSDASLAVRNR